MKIDIRASDLKYYNSFSDCYIPYGELAASLPSEGNLREHLCLNLAQEASRGGALKDAGLYQQAGARGREEHLKSAFLHSSEFYRKKYKGGARWEALIQYFGSRSRGYLWGYRRSSLVILRNWAIVTLGVFPLAIFFAASEWSPNKWESSPRWRYLGREHREYVAGVGHFSNKLHISLHSPLRVPGSSCWTAICRASCILAIPGRVRQETLMDGPYMLALYGSRARGDDDPMSDTDLLYIGDEIK